MEYDVYIYAGDEIFAHMIECELRFSGFTAISSYTAKAETFSYRLLLLDADSKTPPTPPEDIPVIYFSADISDKTSGHLIRPFRISDLIRLISDSLRQDRSVVTTPRKKPCKAEFSISDDDQSVLYGNRRLSLSPREYLLFKCLFESAGAPVSREAAAAAVWGRESSETNVVDVYIYYLRDKLEETFGDKMIRTVRNRGYVLEPPKMR